MKEPTKEKLHYDPKRDCGSVCVGDLFPDFLRLVPNVLNRGRVFSVLIESCGIGTQHKEVVIDEAALKKCRECPDFDRCLQLSMAKLSLQQAVANY